jgi:glycosyltransferase involved in cell wall biosynthesis
MSHCLDCFDDLRFKIIGPVDVDVRPWQRDRMEFVGPIKHSDLYGSVRDCDCLIMPFRLNELVLSVDPVKLYEYVNFGKPIVCTRYPEVERFAPFVSFYNGKDALAQTIGELRESGFARKYSDDDRTAFLMENCWDSRGRQIVTSLEKLHW